MFPVGVVRAGAHARTHAHARGRAIVPQAGRVVKRFCKKVEKIFSVADADS